MQSEPSTVLDCIQHTCECQAATLTLENKTTSHILSICQALSHALLSSRTVCPASLYSLSHKYF